MPKKIVMIDCPRYAGHKKAYVDPDDEKHTRECVDCGYIWQWREGMETYAGEFPEPAAAEVAPPAPEPPKSDGKPKK